MSDFNLADVLRDVNAQDLGQAGREQIVYIDIDLIDPDPKNFYELSELDDLATNIELVGLQQPLRVRVHPENAERYMIVSGHRRRAAIRQLVDDGKDQLRAVACIVEQPAASEALQELRLIYANSGTRKMTPAEISKQAERVEMLLYELKEQGMEFPGRMRDHVAEACKVSKSKLSRLKVIRDNLSPVIKPFFEDGTLAESTAYALAQHPKSWQIVIWNSDYNKEGNGKNLREWNVRDGAETLNRLIPLKCEDGAECTNFERMLKRSMKSSCYSPCGRCCKECHQKEGCSTVCAVIKPEIKAAKEKAKQEKAESIQRQEEERNEKKRARIESWRRLSNNITAAGVNLADAAPLLREYDYQTQHLIDVLENPEKEADGFYGDPFDDWKKLKDVADLLGVSADYLLGRTDTPQQMTAQLDSTPVWRDPAKGDLPEEGADVIAIVQYDLGFGRFVAENLRFKNGQFTAFGEPMPDDCRIFWQPYYDPDDVPNPGTEDNKEEDND